MMLQPGICQAGAQAAAARNWPAAEASLAQCLQSQPDRIEPYLLLAGAYQAQGKTDELYRLARQGMQRFPAERRFYIAAATLDARRQRYEEAIATLTPAAEKFKDDLKIRELLGSAHFALGSQLLDARKNREAAGHLREAVKLSPSDVEAQMNLGRALHNLHEGAEALAVFNSVLEQHPDQPLAYFHRGTTEYLLGEFENAIADLSRELKGPNPYPAAYLVRGLSWIAVGEWEKALPDLETAVKQMPDSAEAQYGRARALERAGKTAEAEAGYRRTMALDPADPGPVRSLGSLLLRQKKSGEAHDLFSQADVLARERRSAKPGEIRFEGRIPPR